MASSSWAEEDADDEAGAEELGPGRKPSGAVPAVEAVRGKEFLAARPGQREHVL
jgi:hypothetical protein